ncbi:transposase, partial [Suttonella ornithocola]|uniref:transposase n=1 Tax=Suttonella ornithocola TaxID=279832 RepID=UPI001B806FD9
IVMDNAAFHKRCDIQAIIEEHGHEIVWLPPYSPDLNPIEKMWAWIKQIAKNGGWIVLILYSFICFGLGWALDDCTIFSKFEKLKFLYFMFFIKISDWYYHIKLSDYQRVAQIAAWST